MVFEKRNEIQQVGIIEGSVLKIEQPFQVVIRMLDHKVIRIIVHAVEQVRALVDDRFSLPPSQNCRKKCGNFDVLFLRKPVGNTYRIVGYKGRPVILINFEIQKIF